MTIIAEQREIGYFIRAAIHQGTAMIYFEFNCALADDAFIPEAQFYATFRCVIDIARMDHDIAIERSYILIRAPEVFIDSFFSEDPHSLLLELILVDLSGRILFVFLMADYLGLIFRGAVRSMADSPIINPYTGFSITAVVRSSLICMWCGWLGRYYPGLPMIMVFPGFAVIVTAFRVQTAGMGARKAITDQPAH